MTTLARAVLLRKAIRQAIEEEALGGGYCVSGFLIGESYRPFTDLENAPANGKVWLLGMASDQDVITRPPVNCAEEIIPITVGYQKLLAGNPTDDAVTQVIDGLVLFYEQLQSTCRNLNLQFHAWQRNESLKDPSGVPYSFTGLRNANVFESYFVALYKLTIATPPSA
jgi:hypothetical protein